MRVLVKLGSCAAALLLGGWAFAEEQDIGTTTEERVETPATVDPLEPCPPTEPGIGGTGEEMKPKEKRDWVSVSIGGGIEGQAMDLAGKLGAGPMWQAAVAVAPLRWMSAEIAYTGATAEVDSDVLGYGDEGAANGADFVRNGGQVAAIFNIPTPVLQPYVLAGLGFDDNNWRGSDSLVYRDDTSGRVPLGGGLRTGVGPLVADLRFNYNVLFSQDFARVSEADEIGATYDLGLQLGGRF